MAVTTHYHPVTGMKYRLRPDGRWEFKQVGLRSIQYPKGMKFRWEVSGMNSGFIPLAESDNYQKPQTFVRKLMSDFFR